MTRRLLERLPIFGCAGFIAFLFLANLWNLAVERDWPKLRIRSAHPLAGAAQPKPAPWTLDTFVAGETQKAVSTNLGRSLPIFPISVRAKNQLLFSLFGASGAANIVVGRDGQLFERYYIDEFCGRSGASDPARIEAWAAKIRESQALLEARGKSFVYLVSPSKAARSPQYLPSSIPCPALARGTTDKLTAFRAALDVRHVRYVDGASLMSAKMREHSINLFPRRGTHWNYLGAALALREITLAFEASGKGSPVGRFDFDWREAPEAIGADRDLLDLLNLLWPDPHYPTAVVTGHGRAETCGRAPRTLTVGGSFVSEIILDLGQSACPPEVDSWHYFRSEGGNFGRFRFAIFGDQTGLRKMEQISESTEELVRSLASAEIVLLEENESNISTMKQVDDLLGAARALP